MSDEKDTRANNRYVSLLLRSSILIVHPSPYSSHLKARSNRCLMAVFKCSEQLVLRYMPKICSILLDEIYLFQNDSNILKARILDQGFKIT